MAEVWVADLEQDTSQRLLEVPPCAFVHEAAWAESQELLTFSVGYEGPPELYMAQLSEGTTVSLSTMLNTDFSVDDEIAFSPDGLKVAVLDSRQGYRIRLISLIDRTTRLLDE